MKVCLSHESGRSMVEMLGVLAIMGVISITMITGYNVAFLRYRAGELMDDISLRSISYVHQMELMDHPVSGQLLNSGEFGAKTHIGYPAKARVATNTDHFEVIVESVNKDVCEMVLTNYTHPIAMRVKVGDSTADYNKETDNTTICGTGETVDEMIFEFSKKFER